eukprot:TRINITY_DN8584_c1_g1_i1.p1 TRINITY_DN8584_c1_g1~~TRINITY_DN8584_c1_g1_i1.p1  ORF type:complete len:203 (+),score=58.73 TRINITY_DN8584_c1_g1_i1:628-1236(+)
MELDCTGELAEVVPLEDYWAHQFNVDFVRLKWRTPPEADSTGLHGVWRHPTVKISVLTVTTFPRDQGQPTREVEVLMGKLPAREKMRSGDAGGRDDATCVVAGAAAFLTSVWRCCGCPADPWTEDATRAFVDSYQFRAPRAGPRNGGWHETVDKATGRAYWYHSQTKEVSWEKPEEAADVEHEAEGSGSCCSSSDAGEHDPQ